MDHYQAIDSFFDSFDLPSSLKLLHKTIKTANTKKKWKGIPANALCFGQAGAVLSLSKDGQPVPMSEASSGAKSNKNPDPHHHRCFSPELKTYELTT
jgi:hypothetical protein